MKYLQNELDAQKVIDEQQDIIHNVRFDFIRTLQKEIGFIGAINESDGAEFIEFIFENSDNGKRVIIKVFIYNEGIGHYYASCEMDAGDDGEFDLKEHYDLSSFDLLWMFTQDVKKVIQKYSLVEG